jgi:hypothetical protein
VRRRMSRRPSLEKARAAWPSEFGSKADGSAVWLREIYVFRARMSVCGREES